MSNPWRLDPDQCDTLNAVVRCGSSKHAANEMGLEYRTVERRMSGILRQMKINHRIKAVIAWDRHARQEGDAISALQAATRQLEEAVAKLGKPVNQGAPA